MATNANICGLVKGVNKEAEKYNNIENKCACCLEPTLTKTKCGHYICFECYGEWRKNKSNCPTCRGEYTMYKKNIDNKFMRYAKNFMSKLKCGLCEKLKCNCSVIDKTFYNAIPATILDGETLIFYRQHRDILDKSLITEFIDDEEEEIKIAFWGKNKFTIYKKGEDWKDGITINYCVYHDDIERDIDSEVFNTLTSFCSDGYIQKFLEGYDVNMSRTAISLLRNAGGSHLHDFLCSGRFCGMDGINNSWIEYILEFKLYKNYNEFPYTLIECRGYDYLKSCDYSERYAYIYEASDDLVNGVISVEYAGECDESE